MANPISFLTGAATKLKSLGGKALDVAGRGALYSQAFNTSSNQMTMGQRIGGAVSQGILDNTLGQMGTLGSAVRAGLQSRSSKQAPAGGTDGGSSSVPFTPIKTDNVVQAINQSTQQILGGLNTLNATFRLGLNATANQMKVQASGVTKLKDDTQDMLLVLNDIYDLLNKQDYESNRSNIAQGSSGVMPVTSDGVTKQPEGSLLQDFLTGALVSFGPALLARALPVLLPAIAAAGAAYLADMGLGALGIGGNELDTKRDDENWNRMNWWQKLESGTARSIENVGGFIAPNLANEMAANRIAAETTYFDTQDGKIKNPNKSRAEAITNPGGSSTPRAKSQNDGKELTAAEIDSIFKAAPENMSDEGLLALAQRMFPGRKYNTLKNRIKQLHMFMQPGSQSSISSGINVASIDPSIGLGDMSSGDYLVNRQKMKDAEKAKTSEAKLRAKEQEYENSVKDLLTMLKYEARDVLFEADNIKFDASKIEFTEGGTGAGGGNRPGGPGGPNGPGGPGADATKVPELSAETKAAAEQLQGGNAVRVAPGGADPLGQYSEEQLRSQNIVSHTNTDGTKVYNYVPGGVGGHADKIGGSGATQSVMSGTRAGLNEKSKLQDYTSTKTTEALGIDQRQYNAFREALAGIESQGGEYGITGGAGNAYSGAYQFGSPAMMDSARALGMQVPSREEFLANPQLQEQFLDQYTALNHKTLMKLSPQYREMTPEQRLGVLGYAHNQGAGGAVNWLKTGVVGSDAFGTAGTKYTDAISQQLEKTKNAKSDGTGPTAVAPNLVAGLQGMQPANAPTVAGAPPGVGPGNVAVKEAYGPNRPGRPEESIRNIASSAAEKAGMSAITFTSGVGDWISPERRQGGQKKTEHSTGKALDVDGFASDEERARFIEEAVSMGANGVGVYKGGSIHIDQGEIRSWDLAKKKIYQDAIARGMEKRKLLQAQAEQKKKEDAEKEKQAKAETQPKPQEETKPKVQIKEESGLEKAAAKFGVTPESKQRMILENKPDQAAVAPPPAATPAKLDPTAVQASQKVSELSKKTTMNREAATTQGPVTQNIISNNRQEADTTGTGYPPKDAPMPGLTATMDKHLDMLWA